MFRLISMQAPKTRCSGDELRKVQGPLRALEGAPFRGRRLIQAQQIPATPSRCFSRLEQGRSEDLGDGGKDGVWPTSRLAARWRSSVASKTLQNGLPGPLTLTERH